MKIQRLFIYPIKSILPVEVTLADITSEGFRFDRQYVVVKAPTTASSAPVEHLTIKTTFRLGLFEPSINDDWSELTIRCKLAESDHSITLPLTPSPLACFQAESRTVSIFGTAAQGVDMGDAPAKYFSKHLGIASRLLFISGSGRREIPGIAYIPKQLTSLTVHAGHDFQPQRIRFADAAPFLVTSTASEEEVRSRLPEPDRHEDVILRLRPNIHIDVGDEILPFDEDDWRELVVTSATGNKQQATIRCVFTCPRCLSLNVDLSTGTRAPRERQLYGLLAKDRRVNSAFPHKPVFGQYAFAAPNGATLRVGDWVTVTERAADVPDAEALKQLVKTVAEPEATVSKEVEMVG